ncbi:helix-turn-helix transcriptional regulator [Cohaesibacter marisflavi]|uniref:helix-turn-helix transcriptional regulator n=1 Tax=Cohaesibacter marisflavi TaxID=655353 RepID=UPI000B7D1AED
MTNDPPLHPLQLFLENEGISQAEFARNANVSRMTVSRVLRGQQNLTLRMIKRFILASNFQLKASDFIDAPSRNMELTE